ncbi:DNA-binding response regulator [Maribacter algicola]|uniref:DNA-binding response regulator n=1 Tax=Maribacter algicola TaxID=2498892 RepID=A0A3R8WH12_9FLAO|nr:response regulator transcription factor [Maribacter algicola]RRQ49892.1 DNA-binding response regulator [Maribacter algicola]
MIRLAIAEDHQSLIDGLELLLKYEENIQIVGTANNGQELLEVVRKRNPNVIITDIRMPIMDGIEATKIIKAEHPHITVLAFTMFDQEGAVKKMLHAGATGYILKNASLNQVLEAILTVAQGGTYYDGNIDLSFAENQKKASSKGRLTKRQKEILSLIAQGKTSREIADELFIGIHTVDTHRKNMMRILEIQGKGELLRYALEKKYEF